MATSVDETMRETKRKMQRAIEVLQGELGTIRTGRASPTLLERIQVDYYGVPTPLVQIAGVSVPEPRLLVIQPWDRSSMSAITKAILASDLGLNPSNDGTLIRLVIPQPTEERRKELVKTVHKKLEESRVAVRNCRRDALNDFRDLEKQKLISEDDREKSEELLQDATNDSIRRIDEVGHAKEKEIMEI